MRIRLRQNITDDDDLREEWEALRDPSEPFQDFDVLGIRFYHNTIQYLFEEIPEIYGTICFADASLFECVDSGFSSSWVMSKVKSDIDPGQHYDFIGFPKLASPDFLWGVSEGIIAKAEFEKAIKRNGSAV